MIVNNWQFISLMYEAVHGTKWVRLYFITFYYFGVIIGINIILAFAIDMYSAVIRMENTSEKNLKILEK
jgi:nitrogen fixation protein FixH